jgi:hypothetical protein
MRQWTLEERQHQAELIQNWKPWKTAGVKTPAGKAISKMNAYKHGGRSAEIRNVLKLISKLKRGASSYFL